jgi:hypothetical protein
MDDDASKMLALHSHRSHNLLSTNNLAYFLIGGGIGLVAAIIGASVEYLLARKRRQERRNDGPPGCLLIVAGALGLVGMGVAIASWLLTHSFRLAVVTGSGVLAGFFIGFAILFVGSVWLSSEHR